MSNHTPRAKEDSKPETATVRCDTKTDSIQIFGINRSKNQFGVLLPANLTRKQIGFVLVILYCGFFVCLQNPQDAFLAVLCIISIAGILVALYFLYDYANDRLKFSGKEKEKEKGQDLEKQTEATVSIKEDERNDRLKFSGKAKEKGQDVAKQTEATGSTKEDETNVPGTKLDDDLELGVSTGISYRDRSRRTPAGEGGKARKDEHDFVEYAMFISAKISFGGKELARLLGLTAYEIEYIWDKHSDIRSKCFDMLLRWRNRKGDAATMQVLMKALAKAGPFDAVDDLKSKFPELKDIDVSDSDSD
ncbi:uncharacterized protein LOC118404077 [Branchiostoma floridae]|uniref:Uncharacterized protein LOC118404077 n=1 Tax=Branchiostoma floridae TaxID=7739 RepID=A0A9J7HID1_BRAFL|nr:uncharacterized protein LOC118404077 [Branchiostoma floridae]XP_035658925.1 uncharacterized protein LOC118404077 [Branchiostoma floridae]